MKMSFEKISHVIFDLDGLIIESESLYDKIFTEIAKQCGKEYTKDIKLKLMGTPNSDTAKIAIEEMQLPYTSEEFFKIYLPLEKEILQHVNLMPGAQKLIEHLHRHNIPIAIATSSTIDNFKQKIQDHKNLISLFHHVVCGGSDPEVKHGKPAPDIFVICASRFPDKPQPDKCLVFEDSPVGAKAAITAKMQVVLVPDSLIPEESRKPATLVLNSLEEFKPEAFGLPPY